MTGLDRIVVIDVETSGLCPNQCSLLEIGAAPLMAPDDIFAMRCRLWPGALWTDGAADVHGWTHAEADSPTLPTEALAVEAFTAWIDDLYACGRRLMLAGMNPRFDLDFLRAAAGRAWKQDWIRKRFSHRTLDMHSLAVAELIRRNAVADVDWLHTDGIYELLGMSPEPRPHRAAEGVRREAAAIRKLLGVDT